MAKNKKRLDIPGQLTLFDLLLKAEAGPSSPPCGSLDIDRQFRECVSECLKSCPLSRYQVAARMAELTGQDITKSMLDSWTAESKELHRFPAIFLPAFCEATGSREPIRILGQPIGAYVLPGPDVLRAEIKRIEDDIARKQCEKKKRMLFLKEMEAK